MYVVSTLHLHRINTLMLILDIGEFWSFIPTDFQLVINVKARCLARRDVKAILAVGKVEETSKIGSTSCRRRLAGKMGDGDVDNL